jgi:DNA polymerase III epsilon subunit-like protein
MKTMILDTETTGFQPGQICQLTYAIVDEAKNFEVIKAFNKFFPVEKVDSGAEAVHGLSVEKCLELSEGKPFAESADEILEDLRSVERIVIHNQKFDVRFMDAELARVEKPFNFAPVSFCTMEHYTPICKLPGKNGSGYKWPKLSEVLTMQGAADDVVLEKAKDLFGCEDIGFHDSRFDVSGLMIIYQNIGLPQEEIA